MSKQVTRSQLVEGILPKIVSDKRFAETLRGVTMDQLNAIINCVLDARNKTFKELQND